MSPRRDPRPRRRTARSRSAAEWSRRRLLALLATAGVVLAALLGGVGWVVLDWLKAPGDSPPMSPDLVVPRIAGKVDARDELAQRPFPQLPLSAAQPGSLTTRRFEEIRLPAATRLGPAGVSSGYPHTPEGALAQLASIDQAALQSASVPGAQAVIAAWAVPGGPTPQSWSGVRAMAGLLDAAGVTGTDGTLLISASPEMGLIKGTVGKDYAVVCVDFVVTATLTSTARVAVADCQRMVWTAAAPADDTNGTEGTGTDGTGAADAADGGSGRWMIGPGPEPAQAPSVWPGTEDAHDVGYRVLVP